MFFGLDRTTDEQSLITFLHQFSDDRLVRLLVGALDRARVHDLGRPKPALAVEALVEVAGVASWVAERHPELTDKLDYEGELGVIIGKRGTNIAEEDAMKYVYGYTIINDVTARDLQKKHLQWFRGKSLDTFCPMGPTVMVGDWPLPFTIYTKVNGSLRQEGTTTDLIFSIPKLIATLSDGMTLLPGDVIATGTPQGVGMGFNPPKFLKKGDVVEINIDHIGTLRNPVK